MSTAPLQAAVRHDARSARSPRRPTTARSSRRVSTASTTRSAGSPAELRPRGVERARLLGTVTDAVRAYLGGDVDALDRVDRSRQPGGAFLQEAWRVHARRPGPGETWSYAELAAEGRQPDGGPGRRAAPARGTWSRRSCRATGSCVRGGSLGGYYYGLPVKRWLLAHERDDDEHRRS